MTANRVVTVYTKASGCMQCVATNEDDMNVAALRYLGITGVPVVLVSDQPVPWVGYRPDRIDALVAGA